MSLLQKARLKEQLVVLKDSPEGGPEARLFELYAEDVLARAEGLGGEAEELLGCLEVHLDEALCGGVHHRPVRLSWCTEVGIDHFGIWARVDVPGLKGEGAEASFRMRYIEPGSFLMGSGEDDEEAFSDEKLQHRVELTEGFWLCETSCTQALWLCVMRDDPSRFKGAQRPVEQVSWDDCTAFLSSLNEKIPGLQARLPTEAQWEYACRAGSTESRYGQLDRIAWWEGNSDGQTHPVGQKDPNAFGLYDMLGNVWEWCADWWEGRYSVPQSGVRVDPLGPDGGDERVLRGGSWDADARYARAAYRARRRPVEHNDVLGFRFSRGQK